MTLTVIVLNKMPINLESKTETEIWDRAISLFDRGVLPRSERGTVPLFSREKRAPSTVETYVEEGEDLVSRVAGVKALSDEELNQRNPHYNGQVPQALIDKASEITMDKYGMDLRWATGFYVELPFWVRLFSPADNTGILSVEGFGSFPAFEEYRHNGKNIENLISDPVKRIAHELVHIARWTIMPIYDKKFEELFAYNAGKATPFPKLYDLLFAYNIDENLEEYGGSLLKKVAKLPFGESKAVQLPLYIGTVFVATLANPFVNGISLAKSLRTFNHVQRDLMKTFGPEMGKYIFGRLDGKDLGYINAAKPDLKEHFAGNERLKGLDLGYSVRAELFKRKLGVATDKALAY